MSEPAAANRARAEFAARFDDPAAMLIRSPGRVNLIGDHTDYSEGFVLPIAIDRAVWLAFRRRSDRRVRLWAELDDSWVDFDLGRLERAAGWDSYVQGVAHVLQDQGHELAGFEGVVTTDLPAGAGLSSSAALELAAGRAFASTSGLAWDPTEMAVASQRAENEWVGMQCGIMDQLVCAAGRAGHALLIDCRSLETTPVAIPDGVAIVVLDTMTRRELVTSAYNDRRRSCEEAARMLGVPTLRDVDLGTLEERRSVLPELVYRRARHVVRENAAVLDAVTALGRGDLERVGVLMGDSHASLRDDYEVTIEALDRMAAIAADTPGCFGARMTGAGFGGSVVALVDDGRVDDFEAIVIDRYRSGGAAHGRSLRVVPSAGVQVVGLR